MTMRHCACLPDHPGAFRWLVVIHGGLLLGRAEVMVNGLVPADSRMPPLKSTMVSALMPGRHALTDLIRTTCPP